ncbi:hypothetical protein B9Z55_012872 [Caenorhabditis nigoni]|uniref:Uncharacterized protein n=1 Tax=Caenorhabditis nigoni TaxID=1611254 RepID=A0A2G5U064_9PELO|nr:hypothetical protein B9Z55_012872 [Caenorhabditis nigoni]
MNNGVAQQIIQRQREQQEEAPARQGEAPERPPTKNILRWRRLNHQRVPYKELWQATAGNVEMYFEKRGRTISPVTYDKFLPESEFMLIPPTLTTNFALWTTNRRILDYFCSALKLTKCQILIAFGTPIDVMRWAALFLHDQPLYNEFAVHRLNGLEVFRLVRMEGGPREIHYRKFTTDGNETVRIVARPLQEGAVPIHRNTLEALTRNLNTICNILHGHRPGLG